MTSSLILPLNDLKANLEIVGGKGLSLAKLANAGFPVPGGFFLTTRAYHHFVKANQLQPVIREALKAVKLNKPSTLETASATISHLFTQASIPGDIADAIRNAYLALDARTALPVAVRSSATAEDLPDASFAGQQETYLNITGIDHVLEAIKKCWASLWTARAMGYRAHQGIGSEGVALAVVVQKMVFADLAGIMFTANPLNGKRDEVVINAAWGLGEAIVSGAVTPDTIIVSQHDTSQIRRKTAEKQIMTVRTASGTEERPVPDRLQNEPVLSDEQVVDLVRYGLEIETLYGKSMDIEWALSEGAFAILQARPITALPDAPVEWAPPNPKGTYMRASVVDLMPKPLSPLFVSLGIPAMRAQMRPLGKRLTGSEPVLAEDYFTSINNFAYMNHAILPKSWWWVLTGLLPSYPRLFRRLVPLWREELLPEYQDFVIGKQDLVPERMTSAELWQETHSLVNAAAYYVCGLMFATMGASAGSEGLLRTVYDRMVKQEGDPDASALMMGWDNIAVRSEKSLYDMAMWAKQNQSMRELILNTPSARLAEQLKRRDLPQGSLFTDLAARFLTHLETFGHIIFQLDFAEPLPRDHPEMMLENIKMYLRGEGSDPHVRQKASEEKRLATTEQMRSRPKGLKRWIFTKALNWGQSMAEIREDALAEIGLAYPYIRAFLIRLGARLAEAGSIGQADDIFWLEKKEIDALVSGSQLELVGRVEERKAFWDRLKKETPPPMMPVRERIMGIKSNVFVPHDAEKQTGSVLKGVATSEGVVSAPARVLRSPEDFDQMRPGDALVAGTTTPAWTPLFAMASAVVTDIGGPLSHGSIIAREYGIPAVMGTGVATKRIRNGQSITVDGTRGEVLLEMTGADRHSASSAKWPRIERGVTLARGSLAEHTPSPVSPLFATLGLRLANRETARLWEEIVGKDVAREILVGNDFYVVLNSYVYGGFRMGAKQIWAIIKVMLTQLGPMFRGSVPRWEEARNKLAGVVAEWECQDITTLSPSGLLNGIRTVFGAACTYYTVIQSTLPAASMSEVIFSRFYNTLVKRKADPEFTTLLFGFENMPVLAEKSLFDIAVWIKDQPALADYTLQTPTEDLVTDFKRGTLPEGISTPLWEMWLSRFNSHFDRFGRTAYEFDFANPTPNEAPNPQFEAVKLFLGGEAVSPYERHQAAAEKRERATKAIMNRIGWPRKGWFLKLLRWAQETGGIREDSIADMGMGHPLIRSMLNELGQRLTEGEAIESSADIYWLKEQEVETLIAALEQGAALPTFTEHIPARKSKWQAALHIVPPVMLPEKSFFQRFIGGRAPEEKNGKLMLQGLGTSDGRVTAPACVLYGPDDFPRMRPGDVLIATTTTPAWTPLFTMASAVVTDIGGPLSHSSIVAREYGIPAVMAVRNATRHIQSGEIVTVDGKAGTVVLE